MVASPPGSRGEAELDAHRAALEGGIAAYNLVDRLPDALPRVRYPRTPGYRPKGEENRLGAWYVKTRIEGRRPASSRAGRWCSRTISALPACR